MRKLRRGGGVLKTGPGKQRICFRSAQRETCDIDRISSQEAGEGREGDGAEQKTLPEAEADAADVRVCSVA